MRNTAATGFAGRKENADGVSHLRPRFLFSNLNQIDDKGYSDHIDINNGILKIAVIKRHKTRIILASDIFRVMA